MCADAVGVHLFGSAQRLSTDIAPKMACVLPLGTVAPAASVTACAQARDLTNHRILGPC